MYGCMSYDGQSGPHVQATTVSCQRDWVFLPNIHFLQGLLDRFQKTGQGPINKDIKGSILLTKRLYGDLNFSHHFIHCVLMFGVYFFFVFCTS